MYDRWTESIAIRLARKYLPETASIDLYAEMVTELATELTAACGRGERQGYLSAIPPLESPDLRETTSILTRVDNMEPAIALMIDRR